MESERAWSYAQELNIQSLQPTNEDKASSLRHQATGRFRRAINWSTQLLSFCQTLYASSRLSARDLLECTIYTFIVNGRFLRYRDDYEDALVQLCVARSLLDELAGTAATSRDQALATLFGDEIGPEIRHCAHEMGHEKAYDVDGIVASLASKHKNQLVDGCAGILKQLKEDEQSSSTVRRQLEPLIWEEKPVPVRNPELVDVLLKVQEAEKKLGGQSSDIKPGSKKAVAAFDAILLALSDAEEVGRRLTEVQQVDSLDLLTWINR
jgi:signal recognition particle subunit SRP68